MEERSTCNCGCYIIPFAFCSVHAVNVSVVSGGISI